MQYAGGDFHCAIKEFSTSDEYQELKTTLINPKTEKSLTLKTPIIGASGTYGYVDEYESFK